MLIIIIVKHKNNLYLLSVARINNLARSAEQSNKYNHTYNTTNKSKIRNINSKCKNSSLFLNNNVLK